MASPSRAYPLPTIPSASNLAVDVDTASSSPRSFTLGSVTRSSSLAPRPSSSNSRPLPEPIGSGSPRETRLYERGNTPTLSSNAFSSSFPSSSMWLNEPTSSAPTIPLPSSSRATLSRHLSISGSAPKTAGIAPSSANNTRSSINWPDSPLSMSDVPLTASGDFREGRSRTRFGQSVGAGAGSGGNGSGSGSGSGNGSNNGIGDALNRSLSIASERSRYNAGGIAISNMSPFMRDVQQLPVLPSTAHPSHTGNAVPHPYSASYSTTSEFFPHGKNASTSSGAAGVTNLYSGYGGGVSGGFRDFSLGAVGSGRQRRRDSFWGTTDRSFREGDEDGLGGDSDEDEEDYAPPTRSGATSRRHSVAAFTATSSMTMSMASPPPRSQIGFHLPSEGHGHGHSRSASLSFPIHANTGETAVRGYGSRAGAESSSRLDDEDLLATDLSNALQLNLEAHAAKQQQQQHQYEGQTSSPRHGGPSHAISLPAQSNLHFPSEGLAQSYTQGQAGTSPYSSNADNNLRQSVSPSRARGGIHERRTSGSGDPYSPAASAARYLATAHNVQPPPLQPQTGISVHYHEERRDTNLPSNTLPTTLWPPPGANVFSQGSPHFRSGTLPPPGSLQNFAPPEFAPGNAPQQAYGYPQAGQEQQRRRSPSSGPSGRGGSMPPPPLQMMPPRSNGGMPPFAGFGGRQHMAGPPPPMVSPLTAHAQPYYVAPIAPQPSLNDLGRGIPLHALPAGGPLYIVEFKAGRTDLFYVDDPEHLVLNKGDLVVVEADRGKDLGKCLTSCTMEEVRDFQMHQVESALGQLAAGAGGGPNIGGIGVLPPGQQPSAATIARMTKEIHPKRIYGRASPADVALLAVKAQDEAKALNVCRAKVSQHQLPMEITDAEFQFDRRRLTFFYVADRRIDFRNLVKDLFRLYKTRVMLISNRDLLMDNNTTQHRQ